jgi:hypothetical protein
MHLIKETRIRVSPDQADAKKSTDNKEEQTSKSSNSNDGIEKAIAAETGMIVS